MPAYGGELVVDVEHRVDGWVHGFDGHLGLEVANGRLLGRLVVDDVVEAVLDGALVGVIVGDGFVIADAEFGLQVVKSPEFVQRVRELRFMRRAVLLGRLGEAGEPGVEVDEELVEVRCGDAELAARRLPSRRRGCRASEGNPARAVTTLFLDASVLLAAFDPEDDHYEPASALLVNT